MNGAAAALGVNVDVALDGRRGTNSAAPPFMARPADKGRQTSMEITVMEITRHRVFDAQNSLEVLIM